MKLLFSTIVCVSLCCTLVASSGCDREKPAPISSNATEPVAKLDGPKSAPDQAVASPNETTASDPPSDRAVTSLDVTQLHLAGLEALQAGQSDAAYDYARQAMRLDGDDPQVIFLMAMVLAERQRFPEAIQMLEGVAETTPQARLPAMGQTADWLVRYGNWGEAEARYREILEQVPDSVLVHRNLASLLLRQGRRVEAQTHLDQLCHLGDVTESELRSMLTVMRPLLGDAEDESFDPIGPLGLARVEIARGDWAAVRNRLQQPDSLGPWESALLGRAYAVLEDFDSLRTWIIEAEESVDVSPDAWFAKGVYAASAGQHPEAIRCFAEAVLGDPTDRDAYANMAQSLADSEATKEAAAAKQRAEMLGKTETIGMQMAGRADRDQESILQLRDRLMQLQRPLEALGWRGVWLTYANESKSISESEVQQILDEIVRERSVLLAEGQTRAPLDFVLCGVNVDALPSPEEVSQRLKSSAL